MPVDTRFIYVLCAVISSGQFLQGSCLWAENSDVKADGRSHPWWLYWVSVDVEFWSISELGFGGLGIVDQCQLL